MAEKKSIFKTLNDVNVAEEKKSKSTGAATLSYLPWSKAWEMLKLTYPDASFEVERFDNKPWQYDEELGYMIHTSVTVEGTTHKMWLPVMDANNMAMKSKPYTYTTGFGDKKKTKTVDAATMRDISDATMRCLVKNIALFGLGLNFYYGEDISRGAAEEVQKQQTEQFIQAAIMQINACETIDALNAYAQSLQGWATQTEIKNAILERSKALQKAAKAVNPTPQTNNAQSNGNRS